MRRGTEGYSARDNHVIGMESELGLPYRQARTVFTEVTQLNSHPGRNNTKRNFQDEEICMDSGRG